MKDIEVYTKDDIFSAAESIADLLNHAEPEGCIFEDDLGQMWELKKLKKKSLT